MAVCSTTALRKYLTQRSNLGQPLREKAVSTTRGHAEGEALITSGVYRRPLFKSSNKSISDTLNLQCESQTVVSLRLIKLTTGGVSAIPEALRLAPEKLD